MRCKVCDCGPLRPVYPDDSGGPWFACLFCGSHCSELEYDPAWYTPHFVEKYREAVGTFERSKAEMTNNAKLFDDFRVLAPSLDFLDVGCCDGAAMSVMQDHGWRVHGWDVSEASNHGSCTTIAPEFRADLFPRQYGAILCREVIEHAPDWRKLLREMVGSLLVGGLLQIQTPRPWHTPERLIYHREHLQIFHPLALREWFGAFGLSPVHYEEWPMGQLHLVRKISDRANGA
jgi:SAM-dependent methyltransferase